MALHDLKPEHFADMEAACDAADMLIAHQRLSMPGIETEHKSKIVGDRMLHQFWYAKHKGKSSEWYGHFEKQASMSAKLTEKNLLQLQANSKMDSALGFATPSMAITDDEEKVKQEMPSLQKLQDLVKCEQTS